MYDRRDTAKRMSAAEVFRQCLESGTLIISTQVVQEFYAAATRKLNLEFDQARDLVADLCRLRPVHIQCSHVLQAVDVQGRFRLSFWDALILATAQMSEVHVLYTEHLQDGRSYDNVRVQNPFQGIDNGPTTSSRKQ